MGRIGSVAADIETGLLAYTVSYYSVEENRSTTWIRICNPYDVQNDDVQCTKEGLQAFDEFVGSEPAWFGNSGCLAYLKGGKLYLRRDKEDVEVEGTEDIEGFLLSPMRDKIILIRCHCTWCIGCRGYGAAVCVCPFRCQDSRNVQPC